ncbi:hypothetical protein DdX_11017 [Ditylenchus destructor]|uniref:Uncharacterized protein n=1 Tax=Ditylenchus destructor TaxID=166010 RepID=A0AAD4R4U4_9BILA|nr:hypothetical protein DdX_11017 [Ditylenchus destructor]
MQPPIINIFIAFLVFGMLNASGRDDDPFESYCYRKVKGVKETIVKCEKEFPYQSGNMTDVCRNGNKIVNCFYATVAKCSEKVALQMIKYVKDYLIVYAHFEPLCNVTRGHLMHEYLSDNDTVDVPPSTTSNQDSSAKASSDSSSTTALPSTPSTVNSPPVSSNTSDSSTMAHTNFSTGGNSDKSNDTSTHPDSSTTATTISLAQLAAIWLISITVSSHMSTVKSMQFSVLIFV